MQLILKGTPIKRSSLFLISLFQKTGQLTDAQFH